MKKLNETQLHEKAGHAVAVQSAQEALAAAVEGYNRLAEQAKAPVEAALARLNEAVADAAQWAGAIRDDQQSYFDGRTEKWQGGEAGAWYADWMEYFDLLRLDEVSIDFPEPLDAPETDAADALEQLPEEPFG